MKKECGQALILVALLMVILFGFAALSIDIGSEVTRGVKLQKAADAAALDGATVAAANNWDVAGIQTSVSNFLQTNYNIPSSEATISPDPTNRTVTVSLSEDNPFHLAPVIGFSKATIVRSATAANALLSQVFNYALFSGAGDINLDQNNINVNGSAHANGNVNITTNNGYINPRTEASGIININCNHFQTTTVPGAPVINMPDLSAQVLAQAQHAGQVYNSGYNIDSNNDTINGTIYVYGNVNIDTNNVKGSGCIFATGDIDITTNNDWVGGGNIAYYSQGNINVNANNLRGSGIFYAPNGDINFNNINNVVLSDGAIIGEQLALHTNTIEIDSSNPGNFPLPGVACLRK